MCCCVLPFGCVEEDNPRLLQERHNAAVQLNVGTRAVSETDGTPTGDEAAIHTLRVYAFVGGKPAGHYFTDNVTKAPHTFFMDIAFFSDGEQKVDFYAVANENAMQTSGAGAPAALSEATTEAQLKNFWFTELTGDIRRDGLPMFCDNKSVTLDFNKVKAESPTDPEHADHSWLDYDDIAFELQRPIGKLGVFAAKPAGESGTLRITGLTMLAAGTRMRNYLMTPTDDMLRGISNASGDIPLAVVEENVTAELPDGISETERRNPENYTPVLNTPFYPFENPWGNGGSWNIQGSDGKGNVLRIDYTYGDEARTGYVYLPAVVRNHYYAICCLMRNDGKITVDYTVAPWDEDPEGEYEIEYNYPDYTNPIQPENGTTLEGTAQYSQPTVWRNNDPDSDEGSYTFMFTIRGPAGQKWAPTLVGTLGTADNFGLKVYQVQPDGSKKYIESADDYTASAEPYYITVKALNGANVGKEVGLGIAYTRDWSPDGSALLLINGLTGNTKWAGSDIAEVVMIRQIEVPQP